MRYPGARQGGGPLPDLPAVGIAEDLGAGIGGLLPPDPVAHAVEIKDARIPQSEPPRGFGRAWKEACHGRDSVPIAEIEYEVVVDIGDAIAADPRSEERGETGGGLVQSRPGKRGFIFHVHIVESSTVADLDQREPEYRGE